MVLKKKQEGAYDAILIPDVTESMGKPMYGELRGPILEERGVRYFFKTYKENDSVEVRFEVSKGPGSMSLLLVEASMELTSSFWSTLRGKEFSLTPEHIVEKHLKTRLEELEKLDGSRIAGSEFLLTEEKTSTDDLLNRAKKLALEYKNGIAVVVNKNMVGTAKITQGGLEDIKLRYGSKTYVGGEAVMFVLNRSEQVTLYIYTQEAEPFMDKILENLVKAAGSITD